MLRTLYEYRYFEILNSARWKMRIQTLIYLSWTLSVIRILTVFAAVFIGYAVVAKSPEINESLQLADVTVNTMILAVLLIVGAIRVSTEKYSGKRLKVRHYPQLNFLKTLDFSYRNVIVVYQILPLLAVKLREFAVVAAVAVGGIFGLWMLDGWFVLDAVSVIILTAVGQVFIMVRNAITAEVVPFWMDLVRYGVITAVLVVLSVIAASYMQTRQGLAQPLRLLSIMEFPGFAVGACLIALALGFRLYKMRNVVEYPLPTVKAYSTARRQRRGVTPFLLTAYFRYLGSRDGFRGIRNVHMAFAVLLLFSVIYRACLSDGSPLTAAMEKLYGPEAAVRVAFFPVMVAGGAVTEFWQQKVGPNVWYRQLRFLWEQGVDSWRITAVNLGFFLLPLFPVAALMICVSYFITGNMLWIIAPIITMAACARLMAYGILNSTRPSDEGREVDITAEMLSTATSLGGYAFFIVMPVTGWSYGLYCLYTTIVGGVTWWALRRRLMDCRTFTLTI